MSLRAKSRSMKNDNMKTILLAAATNISDFGGSELFILFIIAIIFSLGIYTLVKFRKNKNF
jgi:hypothetical protein